ncbi:hydrolase CocE/NonD family protein [Aspergillus californicus]
MTDARWIPASPLDSSTHYPGFRPDSKVLPRGLVHKEGHLPLPCDILLEQDLEVPMRDGVRLYADIYRPPNSKPATLPAILAFSPFGKQGGPNRYNFDRREWRCGVPRKIVSGLEVFEGPDPAYWCLHGYAIVFVDMRGTWNSGGNAVLPCADQGKDGYDVVEWIASREWSNKRVTMSGNSFLAATQWFVGAENPPHLACLAPWEGFSDVYNDQVRRGGIPDAGFARGLLLGDISGKNSVEDILETTEENPLWNSYWESRQAKLANIKVPLYVVASWTNPLHARGTLKGFVESSSKEKWLRVHNSHEWPDLYEHSNVESLRSFYDYYMKGVNNGWIFTPPVRLSVLGSNGQDIVNRPEVSYPLTRQKPFQLFLNNATMSLENTASQQPVKHSYPATDGSAVFTYPIPSRMEFTGPSKLRLFVEADGSDDMDIFVTLEKYNSSGALQKSTVIDVGRLADDPEKERQELIERNQRDPTFCASYFSTGPTGQLRISHRALDEHLSTEFQPVYTHAQEQGLHAGEVVSADLEIWPYAWVFEEGDVLRLQGKHIIHAGGATSSYLLLPLTS